MSQSNTSTCSLGHQPEDRGLFVTEGLLRAVVPGTTAPIFDAHDAPHLPGGGKIAR